MNRTAGINNLILSMISGTSGTVIVDTGLRIAGRNIIGDSDLAHYLVRGGRIHGRRGDTGYFIMGDEIHGPDGDSGYRVINGRIVGPAHIVPWAPHADGSMVRGPGY